MRYGQQIATSIGDPMNNLSVLIKFGVFFDFQATPFSEMHPMVPCSDTRSLAATAVAVSPHLHRQYASAADESSQIRKIKELLTNILKKKLIVWL